MLAECKERFGRKRAVGSFGFEVRVFAFLRSAVTNLARSQGHIKVFTLKVKVYISRLGTQLCFTISYYVSYSLTSTCTPYSVDGNINFGLNSGRHKDIGTTILSFYVLLN